MASPAGYAVAKTSKAAEKGAGAGKMKARVTIEETDNGAFTVSCSKYKAGKDMFSGGGPETETHAFTDFESLVGFLDDTFEGKGAGEKAPAKKASAMPADESEGDEGEGDDESSETTPDDESAEGEGDSEGDDEEE